MIEAGAPARFVRLKLAVKAPAVAVTVYGPPGVLFAVNVVAVAMPFTSVVTVTVFVLFANFPLAPEAGAVNSRSRHRAEDCYCL